MLCVSLLSSKQERKDEQIEKENVKSFYRKMSKVVNEVSKELYWK